MIALWRCDIKQNSLQNQAISLDQNQEQLCKQCGFTKCASSIMGACMYITLTLM